MCYSENWAVAIERIQKYFEETYSVCFVSGTCEVAGVRIDLKELHGSEVMGIPVRRTLVEIEGPEKPARKIHHGFMMNFMSAGG